MWIHDCFMPMYFIQNTWSITPSTTRITYCFLLSRQLCCITEQIANLFHVRCHTWPLVIYIVSYSNDRQLATMHSFLPMKYCTAIELIVTCCADSQKASSHELKFEIWRLKNCIDTRRKTVNFVGHESPNQLSDRTVGKLVLLWNNWLRWNIHLLSSFGSVAILVKSSCMSGVTFSSAFAVGPSGKINKYFNENCEINATTTTKKKVPQINMKHAVLLSITLISYVLCVCVWVHH